MSRDAFYEERDQRTRQYDVDTDVLERHVTIVVGPDAARTVAGQIAVLATVNMVARVHRRMTVIVPATTPLVIPSLVPATTLDDAVGGLVQAIDPYNDLVVQSRQGLQSDSVDLALGIGDAPGVEWSVGADRFAGNLTHGVGTVTDHPSTVLGAGLAACLGSAALLRLALGEVLTPKRASLWNLVEGDNGEPGPSRVPRPIDAGNVVVVGAGAVGSALAYWIRHLGIRGSWIFVDGDRVELHNTNRSLGLLAASAGWADGIAGSQVAGKAQVAAGLVGAEHYNGWYEEWVDEGAATRPDLVIPLANGPGVRRAIAERGEAVLIHAGTSKDWTADLYRHIAEVDGCISCRLPEDREPDFECSVGTLPTPDAGDAALPFLSAAAGLLLTVALAHLQAGRLAEFDQNHWRLHLDLNPRLLLTRLDYQCAATCSLRRNLPQELRRQLARGERWAFLD